MKFNTLETKKLKRDAIRKHIGKFVKMTSGREVLLIEEDYPIMRVFNGKDILNIPAKEISDLLDRSVFP